MPPQRDPQSITHLALLVHAGVACFGIMLFLAFGFSWTGLALFASAVVFLDLILVVGSGIQVLGIRLLHRRSPEAAIAAAKAIPPDAFTTLWRYADRRYVSAVVALVAIDIMAMFAGIRSARTQDQFFEIESKKLIVVRRYGDSLICKPMIGEKSDKLGAATIVVTEQQVTDVPLRIKKYALPPEIEKP